VGHGDAETQQVSAVLLCHPLDYRAGLNGPCLELRVDTFEIECRLLERWRCGVADGVAYDADALGNQECLRDWYVFNPIMARQAHHERGEDRSS